MGLIPLTCWHFQGCEWQCFKHEKGIQTWCVYIWDEKDTEGDDRVEEDENEEEEDADNVNDAEVDFEEVFQEQYRRPCNIHTLQLLVNDCIKLLPVRYQNILKKSKIVCAKQHRSNKLSDAMSVQLPAGCATRWNGQLALMKVIEAHFLEVQQNVGHFLHADLELLRSLIRFFGLFYFLTKKLESEKTSTIQDVIPGLCKLERDIASCACMPTPYIESCLNCFVNRFGFVSTDMHLVSATVLSPHGLKWLKIAATKNKKLQFAQEDVIIQKVKAYTGAVIADLDLQNCPPMCISAPLCQRNRRPVWIRNWFSKCLYMGNWVWPAPAQSIVASHKPWCQRIHSLSLSYKLQH